MKTLWLLQMKLHLLILLALCGVSHQKPIGLLDFKGLLDRLGDEFLTHHGLAPQKSTFQDDIPHPAKVNNFASNLDVGQVSAVAVNPNDQPVIFHRGHVVWDQK